MEIIRVTFCSLILVSIILIVKSVDYCSLQKYCSSGKKHVGCETNIFNKTENPFILQNMTNDLRLIILDQMNEFRNDIAIGVYVDKGFPKASNMRTLRWNYEFEYLAGLSILKLPHGDFTGCFVTEQFKDPTEFHTSKVGVFTADAVLRKVLQSIIKTMLNDTAYKWTSFYKAENEQFGCSFSKQGSGSKTEYLVKCYINSFGKTNIKQTYDTGIPCSKCGVWNEKCDEEKYLGLCEVPNQNEKGGHENIGLTGLQGPLGEKGLKGDTGLKGDKGNDGIPGYNGLNGVNDKDGLDGRKGEHGERGLKGEMGQPGRDGQNSKTENLVQKSDFVYPISFWIIAAIFLIINITSIILTTAALRVFYRYNILSEAEEHLWGRRNIMSTL